MCVLFYRNMGEQASVAVAHTIMLRLTFESSSRSPDRQRPYEISGESHLSGNDKEGRRVGMANAIYSRGLI